MKSRFLRPLPIVAGLLFVGLLAFWTVRAQRGRARAEGLAKEGRWTSARVELQRYLILHPYDAEARLMLAQSLVNDDLLPGEDAALEAIEQLRRIPDESPHAAQARTQQGRLHLLILLQPAAAEESLRRAIQLKDDQVEAHYMLWKLLDLTGRSDETATAFWRVYELTPPSARVQRLREWYMSQFFPLKANVEMERMMGLLRGDESPSVRTELRRYGEFRRREPDKPLAHAAIAHWLLREGVPDEAVKSLDESLKSVPRAMSDPLFVATLVTSLLEIGEFDRAVAAFEQWPGPRDGHTYWKLHATLLDEVHRDFEAATEAYDHAFADWPGPVDWRGRNRKANCLARLGRKQDAARERQIAKNIETLMENDVHSDVRAALGSLRSPVAVRKVAKFYSQLGSERLADAWSAEARRLESAGSFRPGSRTPLAIHSSNASTSIIHLR